MYSVTERVYHVDTARELARRHKGAVISERDGKQAVCDMADKEQATKGLLQNGTET